MLRVQIPSLNSVAFVACKQPDDLAEIRQLHRGNADFLRRTSPLALFSLVYDQRVRRLEAWASSLYQTTNNVEILLGMVPEEWEFYPAGEEESKKLSQDPGYLNRTLGRTNVQIRHGEAMARAGVRYGSVDYLEAIEAVDRAMRMRMMGGGEGGGVGGGPEFRRPAAEQRAVLEDRFRHALSTCQAVLDRFVDVGERHRVLISMVRFIHPFFPRLICVWRKCEN